MLKKSITYESFDGETVTEDFYFHLSKSELTEMELSKQGGMEKWLNILIASNDGATIVGEMKKLILSAYGEKSPDGKRFRKSETLRDDFQASPAFDILFMELATDAEKAAAFVNGCIPQGLVDNNKMSKLDQVKARVEEKNVFTDTDRDVPDESGMKPARERIDPTEPTGASAASVPRDPAARSEAGASRSLDKKRVITRAELMEADSAEFSNLQHLLGSGDAVLAE